MQLGERMPLLHIFFLNLCYYCFSKKRTTDYSVVDVLSNCTFLSFAQISVKGVFFLCSIWCSILCIALETRILSVKSSRKLSRVWCIANFVSKRRFMLCAIETIPISIHGYSFSNVTEIKLSSRSTQYVTHCVEVEMFLHKYVMLFLDTPLVQIYGSNSCSSNSATITMFLLLLNMCLGTAISCGPKIIWNNYLGIWITCALFPRSGSC